jgi:tetratricopeptide (TPR) repeat protein
MDETAKEEILSYVLRAQVRLSDYDAAEKTLDVIFNKSYRSRFYLKSYFVRKSGGNLNEAVTLLKQALLVRKYMRNVVADLALCYHHLGKMPELSEFLREYGELADKNPIVLDLKAAILIAQGLFKEAEAILSRLKSMQGQGGRAECREATIIMKRDRDFHKATRMLTELLQGSTGDKSVIRRFRAMAAAYSNDLDLARRDIAYFRQKPSGEDSALRIEAATLQQEEYFDQALAALSAIKKRRPQDELAKAAILDAKARNILTPFSVRDGLIKEATEIRARNRFVDEFGYDA